MCNFSFGPVLSECPFVWVMFEGTLGAPLISPLFLTVVGRNPAPPTKPCNDSIPLQIPTNLMVLTMVSKWCERISQPSTVWPRRSHFFGRESSTPRPPSAPAAPRRPPVVGRSPSVFPARGAGCKTSLAEWMAQKNVQTVYLPLQWCPKKFKVHELKKSLTLFSCHSIGGLEWWFGI